MKGQRDLSVRSADTDRSAVSCTTLSIGMLVVASAILLSGCAAISGIRCDVDDWFEQGLADGSNGAEAAKINLYISQCSGQGVNPDKELYLNGHAEGIQLFCTTDKGYQHGRKGYKYTENFCPLDMEIAFMQGYVPASNLFKAENRLEWIDEEVIRLERRIATLRGEVSDIESAVPDDGGGGPGGNSLDQNPGAAGAGSDDSPQQQAGSREDNIIEIETTIEQLRDERQRLTRDYRDYVQQVRALGYEELQKY